MYLDNPFFESVDHWVIVWVGDLKLGELEDYLDEPGHAADDEPISDFSRDLGRWYDHDFIWAESSDEQVSLRKLCELNEFDSTEFVEEIVHRGGDVKASSLLVLWNAKAIDQSPRPFADGRLKCIGCWQQESPLTD